MSIISQNNENEVAILDCVQRFFSSHKVGSLLKKCSGTKEKGVPAISLLTYKLSNVLTGRSRVFDRVGMKFRKGFRLLTLGWSNGNTFMPVNSCFKRSFC